VQQGRNGFFEQVAIAFIGFGREKLEGDDRVAGRKLLFIDVFDQLHLARNMPE